ncbi:tRNA-specific adenosine deaminase-like protein 3 [Quillaja saponaria]|uniref:tRNA-specific adenosine deaminase-like protein 3 n=1 Tax=Quillaja saponaria TaxID=32244 RepID=A0AAD7M5P6_QUISA|nr:tRNA-specific adenosine deaminase-like protein 3 [Quillaja saponaria]
MNNHLGSWQIVHIPDKQPVPPGQQPTVSMFASVIDPKHANTIVRRLNQVAPLEGFRHVKRVQKKFLEGGKTQLSVLICLACDNDTQLDNVPSHVQELINLYQLSTSIVKVCKYAPMSKAEWEEQCKLWPTSYHPPTYNIDGITGFNEEDMQLVFKFMQFAVDLATSGKNRVVNAAVIVDPSVKQLIASACDQICAWKDKTSIDYSCFLKPESITSDSDSYRVAAHETVLSNGLSNELRQPYTGVSCLYPWRWTEKQQYSESSCYWHPLRHAAIVAIESSAARDRRLLPDLGNIRIKSFELDPMKASPTSSPAKRQRTICDNVDNESADNQIFHMALARPYLCTGYDIYLVWEPCPMCAMALVHQRIRRIFYAFPNPNAGALGSVHRLQGEKSLNHHYAVFRIVMPEEVLHRCKTDVAKTV